ncbi:MAG: dual specificity protein phosphatase family protein [Polyangiales bacterium]
MKRKLNTLTARVLSGLGLDLEWSVDLRGSFLSPITPRVYLGARPTTERVPELKEAGVTHIVSCLPEEHRLRVEFLSSDFEHLFLGVRDGMHEDIASTFPRFFDFAAEAKAPEAKLFVHCEVGVSRSATLVIALLMKAENLSFIAALRRVRGERYKVLPNIGFASQLQRLEDELKPVAPTKGPSSLAQYLKQVCNAPVDIHVLESVLKEHHYDAPAALMTIFGGEIPRVVQGVRA